MKVGKTIFTATALIVVCSGAALAEDYRYDQVTRVCPSSGEAQCYGTDAQDFIMGTLAVDVIFGKAGDDDIDTEGWEGPFKQPTTIRPPHHTGGAVEQGWLPYRNLEIGESLGRFWRLWCLFYAGVDRAGVLWRRLEGLESKLSFCPYSPMCR
jgi:hypothetical protein